VGTPLVRSLSAFHVSDFVAPPNTEVSPWSDWQEIQSWEESEINKEVTVDLDLSGRIRYPGQYMIKFEADKDDTKLDVNEVELFYDGSKVLDEFVSVSEGSISINRTAQVIDESEITLRITFKCNSSGSGKILFKPLTIY